DVTELVGAITTALADSSGACLVLELWAAPAPETCMRILVGHADRSATTVGALAAALRALELPAAPPIVEVVVTDVIAPAGLPTLLAPRPGVLVIGLEMPPVYRSDRAVYPVIARALHRELAHALQRAFFEFARVQTPLRPAHFHMLGRRRTVNAVRDSDLALADISASFDFLLAVTPINTEAAWQEFCASGHARAPALHYRMLDVDPALVKRELYDLPLERLEDPALAQLLHDKRRELDRQLSLLEDRDTPRFLYGSLQLYGGVEDELLADALEILREVAPGERRPGERCNADHFVARAQTELAHYQALLPELTTKICVRADVSSLIVSHGDMLVPATLDVPAHRVEALLQHELGTHVVTYANGSAQPLRVFASGLAGYESLQEGLATFVEFLVGGLDAARLRLIAARVVAVRRLTDGVSFVDVVAELTDQHRLSLRSAFNIAVRVFRGGGLTKDAIYLRGLSQLLGYLRDGGDIRPLLVGKLALDQVPIVEELVRREVLRGPALIPRWLDAPHTQLGLARAAAGLRVLDLSSGTESIA
ncbi:MAG: DUF1704 domain-containing protein, partial [Deltaproteobacteria bacterium]|nr:DUF1704 domain-containing protein [Deltaproteobacteria bacterium]